MRSRLAIAVAAVAALTLCPAAAASAQDHTAAVPEQSGTLSISIPASVNLGSGGLGATVSAPLGNVRVTDSRGPQARNWSVSVAATDFTTGAGGEGRTIPATAVQYWSGQTTASSGPGAFAPGQATAANAVALNQERVAFRRTGGPGNNSASWTPSVQVEIPMSLTAGTYTGTVTHTVL